MIDAVADRDATLVTNLKLICACIFFPRPKNKENKEIVEKKRQALKIPGRIRN